MIALASTLFLTIVATQLLAFNPQQLAPRFTPVQAQAGLSFVHDHGGTGRFFVWEVVGPGVTVLDYDTDGRPDVYAPQGAPLGAREPAPRPPVNMLFRNLGGRFAALVDVKGYRDRVEAVAGDPGYGMGAAAGDFDHDGHVDLYLTNWGANVLLRNNGDGTFEDVTHRTGARDERWSTAAIWVDIDADADLDLYVTNYLDATFDNHLTCRYGTDAVESYCGPAVFDGVADRLYRNDGDGTFTDVSLAAGIANAADGKGMAVAAIDEDGDGYMELYVANDTRANFLYRNNRKGRFEDAGMFSGTSMSGDGRPQAGMGIVWDDLDEDGDPDLAVTNFQDDYNVLYRNEGPFYVDDSAAVGLRGPSLPYVGFGLVGFDPDLDGDLDLFVANGHIYDVRERYDPRLSYAQPNQLFLNRGDGVFTDASDAAGLGLMPRGVSRGAIASDLDDDGDPDLLVANNAGELQLLANGAWAEDPVAVPPSIRIRLVGRNTVREGYGATITCQVAGRSSTRRIQAGGSFMSQGDPIVLCGLGDNFKASVQVRWPNGDQDQVAGLTAGESVVITEGRGVTARRTHSLVRATDLAGTLPAAPVPTHTGARRMQ